MSHPISLDDYRHNLRRMTEWSDPTVVTPDMVQIENAAVSLATLTVYDRDTLSAWAKANPRDAFVLGIAVGLSQEKMKNSLRAEFDTTGWYTMAKNRPEELIDWLIFAFDLDRLLAEQYSRGYDFGDVLIARAGTRVTAKKATLSGRALENLIEEIAVGLGLPCATRGRFIGRGGQSAPFDLAIPGAGGDAQIVVAAKGFDSTGSKLSDAVREIVEMSLVRRPTQYVMAVVDGIGWLGRDSDLTRLHDLWTSGEIDGMYTVGSLDQFRDDLQVAAVRLGLIP